MQLQSEKKLYASLKEPEMKMIEGSPSGHTAKLNIAILDLPGGLNQFYELFASWFKRPEQRRWSRKYLQLKCALMAMPFLRMLLSTPNSGLPKSS